VTGKRWESQSDRKINPMGIILLDQIDLPFSTPALELFLASDSGRHIVGRFEAASSRHSQP